MATTTSANQAAAGSPRPATLGPSPAVQWAMAGLEDAAEEHFLAQPRQQGNDRHFPDGELPKQRHQHVVDHAADGAERPYRPAHAHQHDHQRRQGGQEADRQPRGVPVKRLQGGLVRPASPGRPPRIPRSLQRGRRSAQTGRRRGFFFHGTHYTRAQLPRRQVAVHRADWNWSIFRPMDVIYVYNVGRKHGPVSLIPPCERLGDGAAPFLDVFRPGC